MAEWTRYRFNTRSVKDCRPLIYNPAYPWWCSGMAGDYSFAVIVAYLPKGEPLDKYWDDAFDITSDDCDKIEFSGRFPRPDDFVETH